MIFLELEDRRKKNDKNGYSERRRERRPGSSGDREVFDP